MSRIKFCVWDMGGVIYDWDAGPFYRWCIENSEDCNIADRVIRAFDFNPHMSGKQSDIEMAQKVCEECLIPYREGIEKEMCRAMMDGNGPEFEVTKNMMEYMIRKGVKNAMLSNASPSFSAAWRNDNLMEDEVRFFSFDLGLVKPDLDIYRVVRDKLGVAFDEMIFVDDKPKNVEAAKSLGIHGIVFDEVTIENEIKKLI